MIRNKIGFQSICRGIDPSILASDKPVDAHDTARVHTSDGSPKPYGTARAGLLRSKAGIPAVALALFLSACGGDDSPSSSGSTAPTSSTQPAPNGSPSSPTPAPTPSVVADQPYNDTGIYNTTGTGNTTSLAEGAAVTHHQMTLKGKVLKYTARVGHLIATDPASKQPQASMSYVAFTLDNPPPGPRPVTVSFNGGPGSPAQTIMMGGFAPKRVDTNTPAPSGEAPYRFGDNEETLLDQTDLVYLDPPGTGWSTAIAPKTNQDFWSTDADVKVDSEFVVRYLEVNKRTDSPLFMFGESYGGPRASMMGYYLQHTLKQPVAGLVLFSPALNHFGDEDYPADPFFPTAAATAWYFSQGLPPGASIVSPDNQKKSLNQFVSEAIELTKNKTYSDFYKKWSKYNFWVSASEYARNSPKKSIAGAVAALQCFTSNFGRRIPPDVSVAGAICADPSVATNELKSDSALTNQLVSYGGKSVLDIGLGIESAGITVDPFSYFALPNYILGQYDLRAKAPAVLATNVSDYLVRDPLVGDISAPYSSTFFSYLQNELKYTWTSEYTGLSSRTDLNWTGNPTHVDPSGKINKINAIPDLRQAMIDNSKLKVIALGGYFDQVCPFYGTKMDIDSLSLPAELQKNALFEPFAAGHMGYTDDAARQHIRSVLDKFYASALPSR